MIISSLEKKKKNRTFFDGCAAFSLEGKMSLTKNLKLYIIWFYKKEGHASYILKINPVGKFSYVTL